MDDMKNAGSWLTFRILFLFWLFLKSVFHNEREFDVK